jgi:predicted nucleic acid-binding protein
LTDTAGTVTAAVLLDTDVFSRVFLQGNRDDVGRSWARVLEGRTVVIAVQTVVELRVWPRRRSWGEKRTSDLEAMIGSVSTIPVNDRVQAAYVDLTVWAMGAGHGIHAKDHTADRWVAATAMAYDLELAAIDGIYSGIEGLVRLNP